MDIFVLVILKALCLFLMSDAERIQDCKLSSDDSFIYKTLDGVYVYPGSLIPHGTRLEVYCRYVDLGDYMYESDAYNDVPHVECSNGELGRIDLKCKQGDPESCTTLENGSVNRFFLNEYKVSCNEGYALNLMRPDMPYCKCQEDKLVCQYGGQTPKCEPEPCKIPYSYDNRLSIFIRQGQSVVGLSGGVSVYEGETMYFNCINTDSESFEPNNRRFKCKNGKWFEDDENDKKWKLGYDGEFPSCRNASCEPPCTNGGKCIRDDRCKCPNLTSGTRCEKVLCDAECEKNGGTCIASGMCGCPKGKYGNNCEHNSCKVPDVSNAVLKTKASKYYDHMEKVQYTCIVGYHFHQDLIEQTNVLHTVAILSSTCEFGNWTNPIPEKCYPDGCRLVLMNGSRYYTYENRTIVEILESGFIPHGTSVFTECITGYDMMKLNGSTAELNPQITCSHGSWRNIHLCKKRCATIKGFRVRNSSDDGIALDFKHGEKVTISCMDDMEITCEDGTWKDFDVLRCEINENSYSEKAVDDKLNLAYREQDENTETTSVYGNEIAFQTTSNFIEYSEFLEEEDEITDTTSVYGNEISTETTATVIDSSESLDGCAIPFDTVYEYTDTLGFEIKLGGSYVTHGTVLNVKCRSEDIYDLLGEDIYDLYGDYYDDSDHPTVQCIDGKLETAHISCLGETPKEEKTFSCNLENGQVQPRSNWQYEEYYLEVSCNEGYKLNLIQPDRPYCKCMNTDIMCDYGGQTPECLPENCKIPERYDSRLQIYVYSNGAPIGLSRGITVKHGNSVYFTCINSETEHFEPEHTRFECMNGKWLEEVTHEEGLKINTRFPQCRNEICLPPCANGGKCVKDNTCECQPQSTGRRCEKDINKCSSAPCKNGGSCADNVNGYNCTCQQGYEGINCENDINECASGPCENGGLCSDNVNGYNCTCQLGFTGINCETDINECSTAPCANGESCADKVNGYTCTCQQGYEGINCETDINECASGPCRNGGVCADKVNGYNCTCQKGYTGINCETDINECASGPCRNGGVCVDKVNGYNCTCQNGHTGINCETDGCLPPKDAPKIEVPKESYEIGEIIDSDQFVCPTNHVLLPRNGMICLRGGWTKTAKCIHNDQSITGDLTSVICGLRPMELESRKKRGITERELSSPNFHRITGGSTAPKGLHPWQVGVRKLILLGLLDMHLCGGTILSEYWILSAAHCFMDLPKSYVTVRIGDHDNNRQDDLEQEFELEHLIIHSQYNESTFDYDIALLKIKPKNGSGIQFGYHVQPACLPDQTSSYVDGQKCHVSGWGKTEKGFSGMLQSARVPIINDKTCRKLYKKTTPMMTITPRMVCAGYLEGGADTCEGDSGGPLVCDIDSRYIVMGATSWGKGCGKADAPGVYARVAAFVPWIKAKVKEYS